MKKKFCLVYFGRVSFEKNIEVLLETVKGLAIKKIPVHLTIIGDGPAVSFLKDTAKQLAIDKNVLFAGVLRGKELAKKVSANHVMVTASTMETQGLTVLEAMSAGLPVVGTDCLGIPDAVKENKNGFLFPPFKPEIAANKLEKIYRSQALYKKLSVGAVQTAKPLSAEQICKEWENAYQKLAFKALEKAF